MRGVDEMTGELFSYVALEDRVRFDHPLRSIRQIVNEALVFLAADFSVLYSPIGRPSIAPTEESWKKLRLELMDRMRLMRIDDPFLLAAILDDDPRSIWDVADHAAGKRLLSGSRWRGSIDLADAEMLERLEGFRETQAMMVDATADMLIDIEQMDREDPSIRYRCIVRSLPRMLARGSTYEQIEASYGITILPEDRLPVATVAE